MAFVYWIRLPEHTDVFTQGYVGVTVKTLKERFRHHKHLASKGKQYVLSRAIRLYDDKLLIEPLLIGSEDYCKMMENKLRPTTNIGWNLAIGGESSPMLGRKHTEETREKLKAAANSRSPEVMAYCTSVLINHKRVPKSEETRIKTSATKQKTASGWRLSWSNKPLWAKADLVYKAIQENPLAASTRIQKLLGIQKEDGSITNIFNKIKQLNWIPTEDQEWLKWKTEYLKGTHS